MSQASKSESGTKGVAAETGITKKKWGRNDLIAAVLGVALILVSLATVLSGFSAS